MASHMQVSACQGKENHFIEKKKEVGNSVVNTALAVSLAESLPGKKSNLVALPKE